MSHLKFGFFPPYQPTAVVVALILFLTLVPKPVSEDIPMFEGADKVVHFIMFGALTGVVCFDLWRTGHPLGMRGAWIVALCSALSGVGIEWLQDVMDLGRGGNDPWDALADVLGAFAAVPVCRALHWIDVLVDNRAG